MDGGAAPGGIKIDEGEVRVDYVELPDGRRLTASPPLLLSPALDEETQQYYVVTAADLGIHSVALTRDELLDELADDITFLWDS